MKIIRNSIIPVKGFKAINLFGILFVREEAEMSDADLNHEKIHSAQMRELLYVGFYLFYLAEWVAGIFRGLSSLESYRRISFEKEAYGHQSDAGYLQSRKPFAQWK